jgi:hypothetical protein
MEDLIGQLAKLSITETAYAKVYALLTSHISKSHLAREY